MFETKLTIFTPTYNRANTVERTYKSLLQQTCKDFEWLIVDDGSTDDTETIVSKWIADSNIVIRYFNQPNGGKHIAYNYGLREAKGELFFCVDSDDWLPTNAVELILHYENDLLSDKCLAGIVALKQLPNQSLIGKPFKTKLKQSSLYHLESIGEGGERSLVFKTEIAKRFEFPDTGEKFVTENVVFDRFNEKYEFIVSNDILTTCEYQIDGLSSNPRALICRNPLGYKLFSAQRIDLVETWRERFNYAIHYHTYRMMANSNLYSYHGRHNFFVKITSPLGLCGSLFYWWTSVNFK